jgi:hypothetical protein
LRSHNASWTSPKAGAAKTCRPTSWPGPKPSTKSASGPLLSPPIFFYFCVSISFEIDAQGWMVVLFCRQLILDFFVLAAHDPIPNQTNMKKKRDDRRLVFEFLLRRRTQKKKKKKKTKLFLSVKKDEDTDRMEGEE